FQDVNGDQYLIVSMGDSDRFPSPNPAGGHFLYKLNKGAPVVHYAFREGNPGGARRYFTRSDSVGRGRLQAILGTTSWSTDSTDGTQSVVFNGQDSFAATWEDQPELHIKGNFRLQVRLKLQAEPAGKSALLAGQEGSFWLEQYPNGYICGWYY